MLIVPMEGKIGWRNPPVVTILLILINCFIYFGFQLQDDAGYEAALDFYVDSGLADMEIPAYTSWLEERGRPAQDYKGWRQYQMAAFDMYNDSEFMDDLLAEKVISPDDEAYTHWKDFRAEFEEKLSKVVAWKYGLRPAIHRPVTFFTSMFLHGRFMHLLGNMIFLWMLGCILEMGCGRIVFLISYILLGVA